MAGTRAAAILRSMLTVTAVILFSGQVLNPHQAAAWDGQRRGFTLGIAGGRGISYDHSLSKETERQRETEKSSLFVFDTGYHRTVLTATEWSIGYSTSDRLLLEFTFTNQSDDTNTLGFGGTYFLKPLARSWFVESRVILFADPRFSSSSETPFGISGGAGESSLHIASSSWT